MRVKPYKVQKSFPGFYSAFGQNLNSLTIYRLTKYMRFCIGLAFSCDLLATFDVGFFFGKTGCEV